MSQTPDYDCDYDHNVSQDNAASPVESPLGSLDGRPGITEASPERPAVPSNTPESVFDGTLEEAEKSPEWPEEAEKSPEWPEEAEKSPEWPELPPPRALDGGAESDEDPIEVSHTRPMNVPAEDPEERETSEDFPVGEPMFIEGKQNPKLFWSYHRDFTKMAKNDKRKFMCHLDLIRPPGGREGYVHAIMDDIYDALLNVFIIFSSEKRSSYTTSKIGFNYANFFSLCALVPKHLVSMEKVPLPRNECFPFVWAFFTERLRTEGIPMSHKYFKQLEKGLIEKCCTLTKKSLVLRDDLTNARGELDELLVNIAVRHDMDHLKNLRDLIDDETPAWYHQVSVGHYLDNFARQVDFTDLAVTKERLLGYARYFCLLFFLIRKEEDEMTAYDEIAMAGLCTALYELLSKVVSPKIIEDTVKNVYTVARVSQIMHESGWRLSQHYNMQKLGRPTGVKLEEFELRIYRALFCKNEALRSTFKPNLWRRNTGWSAEHLRLQYESERSRPNNDLNSFPVLKLVQAVEYHNKYDGFMPCESRQVTEATEATTSEDGSDAERAVSSARRTRRSGSRPAAKRPRGSGGGV